MEPVYLSIQQKATGERIRELLKRHGYTVKDIQEIMGFENPQAVYKWLSGKSLPSIDNFLILSRVLHTNIEDILVIDGDIAFYRDYNSLIAKLQNCSFLLYIFNKDHKQVLHNPSVLNETFVEFSTATHCGKCKRPALVC